MSYGRSVGRIKVDRDKLLARLRELLADTISQHAARVATYDAAVLTRDADQAAYLVDEAAWVAEVQAWIKKNPQIVVITKPHVGYAGQTLVTSVGLDLTLAKSKVRDRPEPLRPLSELRPQQADVTQTQIYGVLSAAIAQIEMTSGPTVPMDSYEFQQFLDPQFVERNIR